MVFKWHRADANYKNKTPQEKFEGEPRDAWKKRCKSTKRCAWCGIAKNPDCFPMVPDYTFGFTDQEGRPRAMFCRSCLQNVLDTFTEEDPNHDKYKSLYRICAMTNLYYKDSIAHRVCEEQHTYEDGTPISENITWGVLYFRAIMDDPELSKKVFYDSEDLIMADVIKRQREMSPLELMSEEDRRNRLQIMTTFHRDVFENEPIEERKILMGNLVTMIDDSMADDYVRQSAAIEIVRTFRRIEKISEALQELQKDPETTANNSKVIKELVQQKKQETDMITAFSKDHGFAEKYALSKSRGSGTLGAIVRDMNEKGYDRGAINKFDIETAQAMRQVAEISAESMMKQLSLTDSDYAQMVKEQATIIRKMQETMEKQAEELRTLREVHLKEELIEEYKKSLEDREIDEDEIDALVKNELERKTSFDYELGQ